MSAQSANEFALIKQFFSQGFPMHKNTVVAVGDDCSVVTPPKQHALAQSIDTFVANIHFPANAPAELIAERCLRCATSDLAAMGALPYGFHLGLTLPNANTDWLIQFSQGLRSCAHAMNISLLGGDTTKGSELVISMVVFGWVPDGKALRRDGARVGDDIWVSDTIGRAALALPQVLNQPDDTSGFAQHYYYPQIQIPLSIQLLDKATSCMDISDGLLQDAAHIARASQVSFALDADCIPTAVDQGDPQWVTCLTGGDDYQLLFTAPAEQHNDIFNLGADHSGLRCIGKVIVASAEPVTLHKNNQKILLPEHKGFLHF